MGAAIHRDPAASGSVLYGGATDWGWLAGIGDADVRHCSGSVMGSWRWVGGGEGVRAGLRPARSGGQCAAARQAALATCQAAFRADDMASARETPQRS